MAFGIEGPRLRLVPPDRERHMENCYRWLNDPAVSENLKIGWRMISVVAEEKFFEGIAADSSSEIMAIEQLDGTHIGMTGLHGIDFRMGHAKTGMFIGSVEHQGQGFGTESGHLRSYLAFYQFRLRMLYSEFYTGNTRSEAMQKSLGYETWGVMPEGNYRNGAFRDVICTYCRREMWEAVAPDWLRPKLN